MMASYRRSPLTLSSTPASMLGLSFTSITTGPRGVSFRSTPYRPWPIRRAARRAVFSTAGGASSGARVSNPPSLPRPLPSWLMICQ